MKHLSTAIVVAFHKYTPFGGEFYEPILDFFLQNMKKYENEYDHLYILDSTWNIDSQKIAGMKAEIIKINPSLRYYDAYKEFLPQVKELLVLFVDNDMVIYQEGMIKSAFEKLEGEFDVVSIYDTIGEKTFPQLNNKSKFCPYWFATGTTMLKDFVKCDWGPNMPLYETLGQLSECMLKEEVIPYEWEEDKSSIYFDGAQDGEKGKNLGYYHIRSGSLPAYLLATKFYGNKETYSDYINQQPKREYLRQCAWFRYMCLDNKTEAIYPDLLNIITDDMKITLENWDKYFERFLNYHGL